MKSVVNIYLVGKRQTKEKIELTFCAPNYIDEDGFFRDPSFLTSWQTDDLPFESGEKIKALVDISNGKDGMFIKLMGVMMPDGEMVSMSKEDNGEVIEKEVWM